METSAPEQPVIAPETVLQRRKSHGKRLTLVERNAIIARAALQQPKTQIAKDMKISRDAVNRTLKSQEIQSIVAQGKSDVALLIPAAVKTVGKRIRNGSETASLAVLKGMRVLEDGNKTNVFNGNTQIIMSTPAPGEWDAELANMMKVMQLATDEITDSVRSLSGECPVTPTTPQLIDITPDTDK